MISKSVQINVFAPKTSVYGSELISNNPNEHGQAGYLGVNQDTPVAGWTIDRLYVIAARRQDSELYIIEA